MCKLILAQKIVRIGDTPGNTSLKFAELKLIMLKMVMECVNEADGVHVGYLVLLRRIFLICSHQF